MVGVLKVEHARGAGYMQERISTRASAVHAPPPNPLGRRGCRQRSAQCGGASMGAEPDQSTARSKQSASGSKPSR